MGIFREIKIYEDFIPKSEWFLHRRVSLFCTNMFKITRPKQKGIRRIPNSLILLALLEGATDSQQSFSLVMSISWIRQVP